MNKKLILVLIICISAILSAALLVGCDKTTLANPRNVDIVKGSFVWDKVEGADGYLIYFNDNEINRFYTQSTSLPVDNSYLKSSLISGKQNYMMIRAVTVDETNQPVKLSNRSKLLFDYSRKLATPNKLELKNSRFAWRSVSDADDYKARVRIDGETEYKDYKLVWTSGVTSISGTIEALPDGHMYYVAVVATAEGFEDSDASVEVPYDRTVINADDPVEPPTNIGKWTVTFDLMYKVNDAEQTFIAYAEDNKPVGTPATRTREGFVFDGWFEDSYLLVEAGFTAKQSKFNVTCNTTLYAKWKSSGVVVPDIPDEPDDPDEPKIVVDTVRDGFIYLDASALTWFESNKAKISCKITYKDNSVNSLTSEAGTFANGLYKWGFNKLKSFSTVSIIRTADNNESNTINLDMSKFAISKPVYKLVSLVGDVYSGSWSQIKSVDDPKQNTSKLYLDASAIEWFEEGGAVINVHIWYTDGVNNSWPGAVMTKTDGIYSADYFSDKTIKGIIFTRNDPALKPAEGVTTEWNRIDLGEFAFNAQKPVYKLKALSEAAFNGVWLAVGEEEEEPVINADTLYLDYKDADWFGGDDAIITAYIWYSDASFNAVYPGETAVKLGNVCYVSYDKNKTISGIIFTRNDPKVAVTGEGAGLWNKLELVDVAFDSSKPAFKLTSVIGNTYEGVWETKEAAIDNPYVEPEEPEESDKPVVDPVGDGSFYLSAERVTWFASDDAVIKCEITYTDKTVSENRTAVYDADKKLYSWKYNKQKTISAIHVTRNSPVGKVWNEFTYTFTVPFDEGKNILVMTSLNDNKFAGTWESEVAPVVKIEKQIYLDYSAISWYNDDSPKFTVYIWYTDGTNNGTYPGEFVTAANGLLSYTYDGNKTVAGVIFGRWDPATDFTPIVDEKNLWNKTEFGFSESAFDATKPCFVIVTMDGHTYTGAWSAKN